MFYIIKWVFVTLYRVIQVIFCPNEEKIQKEAINKANEDLKKSSIVIDSIKKTTVAEIDSDDDDDGTVRTKAKKYVRKSS